MASNPDQFLSALIGTTGLAPIQQLQANSQNLRLGEQQLEGNQFALNAKRDEQQLAQQYQADVQAYFRDPSPQNLAALMAKYPQQADELGKAYSAMDEPARRSQVNSLGSLYYAARNNRSDIVVARLEDVVKAEKARGLDTSEAEQLLAGVRAGDPEAIKDVLAFSQAQLAFADPKFAQSIGAVREDFTLSQGQQRISGQDGSVISSAAPEQKYLIIPEGGRAEPVPGTGATPLPGGGGQSSGGAPVQSPTGARRTQGWSPRMRDGGDNTDAAVDGKIGHLSRALGVDPDTPLTPEQFARLGPAIAVTEGGAGSLADRNNNPGNIKDGPFARSQPGYAGRGEGGFARFKDKASGMAATQALLGNYRKRGQVTIRDIVEGRPVGSRPQQQAQSGTIYGAPKRGWTIIPPEDAANIPGLQPGVTYQRGPDGQIQPVSGTKPQRQPMTSEEKAAYGLNPSLAYVQDEQGVPQLVAGQKTAPTRVIPAPIVKGMVENRSTIRSIDSAISLLQRRPQSIGPGTGALGDTFTQWNDPEGTETRAAIAKVSGYIVHDLAGASQTVGEVQRLAPFIPQMTDRPEVALRKLKALRTAVASQQQDLEAMYGPEQGYIPFDSGNRRPASQPQAASQRRSGRGAAPNDPVFVRSVQEAQKLPKGTWYVAPGGKLYRR